jgi:hypothetical protein
VHRCGPAQNTKPIKQPYTKPAQNTKPTTQQAQNIKPVVKPYTKPAKTVEPKPAQNSKPSTQVCAPLPPPKSKKMGFIGEISLNSSKNQDMKSSVVRRWVL